MSLGYFNVTFSNIVAVVNTSMEHRGNIVGVG